MATNQFSSLLSGLNYKGPVYPTISQKKKYTNGVSAAPMSSIGEKPLSPYSGTTPSNAGATSTTFVPPTTPATPKQEYTQSIATNSTAPITGNATTPSGAVVNSQTGATVSGPTNTPVSDPTDNYRKAFDAYLASLSPTSEETVAQSRLNELTTQNRLDYEKALGSGETLGYATGLAGEQARTAGIQEAGAAATLDAFRGRREAMTEAQKARLEYEKSLMPEPEEGFTLGEGQVRYDAEGNIIGSVPKTYAPSSGIEGPSSYQEWVLSGSPGTYTDFLENRKPPTAAQNTVGTYAARIEQSNPTITNVEANIAKMNPLVFEAQRKLPSYLQTGEFQSFDQAARNFINAVLRRESGAVISPSEFDNAYKQYLPRAGDTEETLAQKKKNRDIVFATFKQSAGPAYQSVGDLLGEGTNTGQTSSGLGYTIIPD